MGRKNLLQDLMGAPETKAAEPRKRPTKGAIGAVSKSIADLKSRSVTELPHPNEPERYQIVYGRRRVAALRDLRQPVKALIRDLDDAALIIAQGQENAARKDLSFIEKVNFARQMSEAGYDRKAICAALHIDKTVISRMLMIADCVPVSLIEMIGPAPSVGRDRWMALANTLGSAPVDIEEAIEASEAASDQGSDASFEAVLKLTEGRAAPKTTRPASKAADKPPRAKETPLKGAGGTKLGSYAKTAQGPPWRMAGQKLTAVNSAFFCPVTNLEKV